MGKRRASTIIDSHALLRLNLQVHGLDRQRLNPQVDLTVVSIYGSTLMSMDWTVMNIRRSSLILMDLILVNIYSSRLRLMI